MRNFAILTTLLLLLPALCHTDEKPQFREKEYRIRNIFIRNLDVFDSTHPDFDTWYFQLANKIHIRTRQSFIRKELLFSEGEKVFPDLLRESERNLRRYNFLTEVSIDTVEVSDDEVDLYVNTEDQWTTQITASAGRTSGETTYDFGFTEENFLGLGKTVEWRVEQNRERSVIAGGYFDPRFLDTRIRLNTDIADYSDGHRTAIRFNRPFHSQDAEWAYSLFWNDLRRDQHLYFTGTDVAALVFKQQAAGLEVNKAWGERYKKIRAGIGLSYEESIFPGPAKVFAPEYLTEVEDNLNPPDKRLLTLSANLIRDRQRFTKFEFIDRFGRTEDYPVGLLAGVSIARSLAHDNPDYVTTVIHGRWATRPTVDQYFVSFAEAGIRREAGDWNNIVLNGWARYYKQSSRYFSFKNVRRTLALNFNATLTEDVDAPFQLTLGEDEGLRGYTFRRFVGLNRLLLNVEDRVFLPWENRFVGIGLVPFFDAGYLWGSASERQLGASIGIGIRLGFKKLGRTQVVRIDFAYPLIDGDGISISTKSGQVFRVAQ